MADDRDEADVRPEFRAAQVVGRTFSVWTRTLPQLLAIAAIVQIPLLGLKWWLLDAEGQPGFRGSLVTALPMIELVAVNALAAAFAVRVVFQRLRGERVDVGRSINDGLRRLATVIGITLIVAVPQALPLLFAPTPPSPTAGLNPKDAAPVFGFMGMVSIALIVMFVIELVFPVAMPAALVERIGAFRAFGRSRRLTSGCRLRIFGLYILFGLCIVVPEGAWEYAITATKDPVRKLLLESSFSWIAASLACVLPVVLYHALRESKEPIGTAELAGVFD